ncbi:TonB-dependent receptor [Parabacteroides sp. PF5-9]|uniref:TonB-dependent receptor n=1 Tax=Parabacteroides sp. PF5-9 TaxID=1742404 RepID=UPI002472F7C5|nr:TonB-dependent receptor [Parabacteroides sp. PF5-9]MDH6358724.1 TonB-linked SusC/RagA family outer membrane protein [Parabacteroides sp. PF5-9]
MSNIKQFLTRLLLCCCVLVSSGYMAATQLTLDIKEKSVRDVIKEIEKASDYRFFYNEGLIGLNEKISIEVNDENIETVLEQISRNTTVTYTMRDNHQVVLFAKAEKVQQNGKTISGTITDNTGEPLIGVNVQISGVAIGTISDVNGEFTLQGVTPGTTLLVSYIGYVTQQIRVGDANHYNITMREDSKALDEVVVVGYGTQKKATLVGAVASINSDELLTTKTDNVINNMQGKMAGLLIRQQTGEPGDFGNMISIRGFGTPVIVIDGIVRTNDGATELAQLTSDDIESVSILKDASAAIYGMNAANGVIIVTTKKGEEGKARLSYSGLFGMKMPTGMPEMANAYQYRMMENEFQRNIGAAPRYSDDLLQKYKNGEPGYQDWDWIDMYMYKSVPAHNHTVSVRGGSDKVKYFTSLGYNEDNGLLKSDVQYYKRYTFRSNVTAELTKDLKMNVLVSGRVDKSQRGHEDFIWTYKSFIVNDRGVGPYALGSTDHLSAVGPEDKNPAALISPDLEGYRRNENTTGSAQLDLTYTAPFLPGLSVNVLGSYDIKQYNESDKEASHDLYDYYTDTYTKTRGQDRYWNQIRLYNKAYTRIQANYSEKFGDHSLDVTGVFEASQDRYDKLRGDRSYSDLFTFDILDQASASTASNEGNREFRRYVAFVGRANYDYKGKYLLEGMIRRDGSYRYAPGKRWATFPSVSAAWRVSEEEFFKNLAPFVDNLKLRASYGESGRDQGNAYEYLPAYTSDTRRGYVFEDGTLTTGMYPPGVVNDNMTWVKAKFFNVGVDLDILRNKFSATFEYFQRKNTGILANRISSVPNTFGASFPQENLNSDLNRGIELQLKYRDGIGKDFKYTVGANLTFARTKRLHVERAPFTSQWDRWRNGNEDRYTGRSLIYSYNGQYGSLNEYEAAPLSGGNRGNSKMLPGAYRITDVNGDGRISGEDQLFKNWSYGTSGYTSGASEAVDGVSWNRVNPPLQFGFTFDGSYKSWDLSLLLQGAALYSLNYHMNDIWGYGRYPTMHARFLDRWHTASPTDDPLDPNTQWIAGKFPAGRPYNYDNTTDANIIDVWRPKVAYLRLKNIELGYTVPQTILNKVGIERLRVFVNGTNLLTFAEENVRKMDPERQENAWNAGLSYPIMKAVNFGVNLNF